MRRVKQTSVLLLRLAGTFIVMLLAYVVSTMVIGGTSVALSPEEASQAGQALVLVSLIERREFHDGNRRSQSRG